MLRRLAWALGLGVVCACTSGGADCPRQGPPVPAPARFVVETLARGFDRPVGVALARDGRMFVAEKDGRVRVVKDGVVLPAPFVDLRDEVRGIADGGLLGLELHPDFPAVPWVYLLYVVDPVPGRPDEPGRAAAWGRLTRYAAAGDVADPASRQVLLGATPERGPPLCFPTHAVGSVKFAFDGSLFVGTGDGAHADRLDDGANLDEWDHLCEDLFGASEDLGALRAQSLESLAGKLLRLDAETGRGLPGNPYFDGDPDSRRSRVWALGLRNPFRFQLRPGSAAPGTVFLGDVGADDWEELDVSRGGENFGWPCFEGASAVAGYRQHPTTGPVCNALAAAAVRMPALTTAHTRGGAATSGVAFYTGSGYPERYRGALFLADYVQGSLRAVFVDATDRVVADEEFLSGLAAPVDLAVDPATGDLVFVSIEAGSVHRVRYTETNLAPVVAVAASPAGGAAALDVQFTSDGTVDEEGDRFRLRWDFGDGSPIASGAHPVHRYPSSGTWVARLTACDVHGNASSAAVAVTTGDTPPTVRIVAPESGAAFAEGESIPLEAVASDAEDGVPAEWDWRVDLLHGAHPHYDELVSSEEHPPAFITRAHSNGARLLYRITATVTDRAGLSTSAVVHGVEQGTTNTAPSARSTATPLSGEAPLVVHFDASASSDPDGDLLSFVWAFGDGQTSEARTVTHIYDAPGTYDVRLLALDPLEATDVATLQVRVHR